MSDSRQSKDWDDLDRLLHMERALGPIHRSVSAVVTRSGSWYLLIWEGQKAILKQVGASGQKLEEPKVREGHQISRGSDNHRVVLHGEGNVALFLTSPVVEERDFDKWNNHAVCRIVRTVIA